MTAQQNDVFMTSLMNQDILTGHFADGLSARRLVKINLTRHSVERSLSGYKSFDLFYNPVLHIKLYIQQLLEFTSNFGAG